MTYGVGSLVRARGREWVVLPESNDDLLVLRPLGGMDDETTGIYLPLEPVEPAHFDLPAVTDVSDHRTGALLRDAVRLSSRASTGPFRSFGRIAVESRPYQLVPLLMALRLDPVRILIADDVGIGKTIEALLIARELLDRGEIRRMSVLCPPHLAEQWQKELSAKFHIDAELVLSSTVARLERNRRVGQSVFDVYPYTVVSMDYIKSDRRRQDFISSCPEFVIVDEAHTCASSSERRGGRHQRYELIKKIASAPDRHVVLVTATPHTGKEETFRSLLGLLSDEFADLPEDLSGAENQSHRRRLARYLVQRRRADIRHYLKTDTPFPTREEAEITYHLSDDYRMLFDRVMKYARETVQDETGGKQRQRVRWWGALALLRSVGSSPAAAVTALKNRSATIEAETEDEANEIGRRTVFDEDTQDQLESVDVTPGAKTEIEPDDSGLRALRDMERIATRLHGDNDPKLKRIVPHIKQLLAEGYRPILFCRFIPTAEYLARELRDRLANDVDVRAVTGNLTPADRETRVLEMAQSPKRVLVATDCLSEGINLQDHFDAVIHYDLAWNPTRHEQREGRVDRYGQPRSTVRTVMLYGADSAIDGIVLDVLLRKHRTIRNSLGISVPVPDETDDVVDAIFEGLLLREQAGTDAQQLLPGLEHYLAPKKELLFAAWENATERERRSRTVFAQETIRTDEVAKEWDAAREAIGSAADVEQFVVTALKAHRTSTTERNSVYRFQLSTEMPRALRDRLGPAIGINRTDISARFELPVDEGVVYLERTHPFVEALATYVLDTALDPNLEGVAKRAGASRTDAVAVRTTLIVARYRYTIITRKANREERNQLAEECRVLGYRGAPEAPEWLDDAAVQSALDAEPSGNITDYQKTEFIRLAIDGFPALLPHLESDAQTRASELVDAHVRVREAARITGVQYSVEPQLPVDVLGVYVLLPAPKGGAS